MIPQSFIQELLSRVNIVDVVERYVKLKKAGANYVACCPFHTEKTPSFSVSPSKQFYHCFGCGAHGSAIGFVMAYAGLGFVDAVHELAAAAGMPVPVQRREEKAHKAEDGVSLTDVMARAARFYREQLKRSPRAIAYLKGRGLTGEIAARFGIGYAPDGWQNLEQAFPDYRAPQLLETGLVVENEQGRRYDRFRDRIVFPIVDGRGNVIGFGGRVIDTEKAADGTPAGPKYLNSPETPLFEKGRELYGLPQARDSIRAHDTVIVVEGYMDVVALAQHGVGGAVATLGTATTGTTCTSCCATPIASCSASMAMPQAARRRGVPWRQAWNTSPTTRASPSCSCRRSTTPTVSCASRVPTPSGDWRVRPCP